MTAPSRHDVPRVDLPAVRHQQVRRLLVQEAGSATTRVDRVRRLGPIAVAAAVAATVSVVAVGPGDLVRAAQRSAAQLTGTDPDDVTCETGAVPVDPSYADGIRLLSADPGGRTLEAAWANLTPACQLETPGAPVQVVAAVDADGMVTSALTVWRDLPVEGPGEAGAGPSGSPVGPQPQQVRGVDGAVSLRPDVERVQVWWSEGGVAWSVVASGLDAELALATVERLDLTADRPLAAEQFPPGAAEVGGWTMPSTPDVVPVWYAEYGHAATESGPGTDEGGSAFQLQVSGSRPPWQTELRAGQRIVDVHGVPAVSGDDGGGGRVPFVTWEVREGVQASVQASVPASPPGSGDDLVAVAESLEHVEADDPRLAVGRP